MKNDDCEEEKPTSERAQDEIFRILISVFIFFAHIVSWCFICEVLWKEELTLGKVAVHDEKQILGPETWLSSFVGIYLGE